MTDKMLMRHVTAVFFWGCGLMAAAWVFGWGWFIKDGLGPGFVESHGLLAWQRWWSEVGWTGVLCVVVPLALGFCIWPWRKKTA